MEGICPLASPTFSEDPLNKIDLARSKTIPQVVKTTPEVVRERKSDELEPPWLEKQPIETSQYRF
jgi:hypothetical protein